jgi:hypothetical protein
MDEIDESPSRRAVLRRGAALGGALVWTVPVVQSVTPSAFAVGSPAVEGVKRGRNTGVSDASGLADTGGSFPTAQMLAAGTALVAGGAAVAARGRRPKPAIAEANGPADHAGDGTPSDATSTDPSAPSAGEQV